MAKKNEGTEVVEKVVQIDRGKCPDASGERPRN